MSQDQPASSTPQMPGLASFAALPSFYSTVSGLLALRSPMTSGTQEQAILFIQGYLTSLLREQRAASAAYLRARADQIEQEGGTTGHHIAQFLRVEAQAVEDGLQPPATA